MHVQQSIIINPAFAFPLVSSYDKHGVNVVVSGKREGALAGNSRSVLPFTSALGYSLCKNYFSLLPSR